MSGDPTPGAIGAEPYRIAWHGDVAEIALHCGKANALNPRSLAAIDQAFGATEAARGVVLAGYDRFFSAGLDLVTLYDLSWSAMDAFMREFDRVMLRVFAFPRPVVAALDGHAVAGGCILALACDARVAPARAEAGIRIGLNEIQLGVPFPASALEIVRHAIPTEAAETVLYGGELYTLPEARAQGLVSELAAGDVRAAARVRCERLAERPAGAFATIKASLRAPAIRRARESLDELRHAFVQAWFAPDARQRIGDARATLLREVR